MRFAAVCLSLIGFLPLAHAQTADIKLERGAHGVGFRVLQQYDHSRVYKMRFDVITGKRVEGERARPVQTLVWYPSAQTGAPIAYSEYLRSAVTEEDFTLSPQEVDKRAAAWVRERGGRMDKELLARELRKTSWAIRDAAPAAGKFPVVLYAPSLGGPAHENVELCEFLASQGYVVLSSASIGARTRAMTDDLEGLEAQAADIAFLLASAYAMPQADTARVGVVGFSWGGLANVIAAARDDRIGAVVSLDGSLRSYPKFVNGSGDAARGVTPERAAVPLLFIGARPKSLEQFIDGANDLSYSFINNMKYADVYIASMAPMLHPDFSSYALRIRPYDPASPYTRDEILVAHGWMVRYVHQFLDAYLKGSAPAMTFMRTSVAANGSPRNMMTLDSRIGKGKPASFENLAHELNTKGYDLAVEIYRRMQKSDPKFQVSERSMDAWGHALFGAGRKKEAMEVFRLGVSAYPQSAGLFESMGDMYKDRGDKQRAITYYRRSLEFDPDNVAVADYIRKLAASR